VSKIVQLTMNSGWQVEKTIEEFVEDVEVFIGSYSARNNRIQKRAVDFDDVLEEIRFMLKRIKKGLPLR
jgi:hypothetical protein